MIGREKKIYAVLATYRRNIFGISSRQLWK